MLSEPMEEQKEGIVRIDDLSVDSVRSLLRFIYTANTTVSTWDDVAALLYAADKYALPRLKEWCSSRLQILVSSSSVLRTRALIEIFSLSQGFRDRCKEILLNKTDDVVKTLGTDPDIDDKEDKKIQEPASFHEVLSLMSFSFSFTFSLSF